MSCCSMAGSPWRAPKGSPPHLKGLQSPNSTPACLSPHPRSDVGDTQSSLRAWLIPARWDPNLIKTL